MSHLTNHKLMFPLTIIVLGITVICAAQTNRPLTNDDIINMVQGKVDDENIYRAIATSEINFDISPNGLIQLKKGKVKKQIITAIQNAQIRKNNSTANSSTGTRLIRLGDDPAPTPSPTPKPTPVATQDVEFFTFDIERCSISGSAVLCYFRVTNKGTERHVGFMKDLSGLVDYSSNPAKATDYKFGSVSTESATGWKPIRQVPYNPIYQPADILPNGSAAGWVRFDGVAPDTQKIGKLTLGFSITGGNSFSVPFRDIPVEK